MIARIALAAALLALPLPLPAQSSDAEKRELENMCRGNPHSAVCVARQTGQNKNEGIDLAARVKNGERGGLTPVTPGEITRCWAVWTAIKEHVAANGRGTFPEDYTVDALTKRAKQWSAEVKKAFAGDKESAEIYSTKEIARARTEVAGPLIVTAAEMSGFCKTMPRS
jgi:hypothetical protein